MAIGGLANGRVRRIVVAFIASCAFAACAASSRGAEAPHASDLVASRPVVTTTTAPRRMHVVHRVRRKAVAKKVATTTVPATTPPTTHAVPKHIAPPVTPAPAPVQQPVFPAPAAIASAPAPPPVPAPSSSAAESQLVSLINGFRSKHGLGPLSVHATLVSKARSWAAHMASGGCGMGGNGLPQICHSNLSDGINVQWSALEENVGMCSPKNNVSGMEGAFENSPGHAANMLSTKVRYVGVGFAYVGNYMYVAEEFMG
jgi:uncharacterized protein YkwD